MPVETRAATSVTWQEAGKWDKAHRPQILKSDCSTVRLWRWTDERGPIVAPDPPCPRLEDES